MDENTFWELIEKTHRASPHKIAIQYELLVQELVKLSPDEIIAFEAIFYTMYGRSNKANLWDAAAIIACGCSDSGFGAFQGWLIAQGRTIFENALRDPESLADVVEPQRRYDIINGSISGAAYDAYELMTGRKKPQTVYGPFTFIGELQVNVDDVSTYAVYPRLAAVFSDDCDD